MGCGGSRLGGVAAARADEGGVVPLPAGIRPLLRRRLDEMKKRSHANVFKGNNTLSKTEFLRHNSSEDGDEKEENVESLKLSSKVAPAPEHHVEEKKEVIYEKVSSIDEVKEEEEVVKKQDEKNDDAVNVKKEGNDGINHDEIIIAKKEGGDGVAQDGRINLDEVIIAKKKGYNGVDHDEGRMSNLDERMICPGSPSFRVYCIDVASDDDEEEKYGEVARKSMETESISIEPKEDESIVKKEKRERKGNRFGIALPRKYLANVTAQCYANAGCMGNNTHTRRVQEKSSQ
ncbi:hypothetical protein Rs2_40908 [Raphanus sativus]|uniref:Uncharacterized protein LOC108831613 n=1 Tax=Raphanus sativus TaxID=3726 RepID=A0A9W3CE73_RAPSA|nr:uncharacterized protein LOC108831613 [Raphanus sativus]KAJ4875890.1 hypothetical protein Rs2_40908 [Raphanus sativus]